jgi:tagaturonate reductase
MNLLNKNYCINTLGIPAEQFELPEKVLQFGTGVLLRGLPDFLIDRANKKGIFNGRIVVVKTTGAVEPIFSIQDNCYTLRQRGIVQGAPYAETTVITAISRVLSTVTDWQKVLSCASNPDLEIIISNTTEAGLQYVEEDITKSMAPKSFPAKLTRFLYERFCLFEGAIAKGLTIVPTELIVNNGSILKQFVIKQAQKNHLPQTFIDWLSTSCDFCDSLVDKIVTGSPSADEKATCFKSWHYEDNLCIDAEPFALWAIEGTERAFNRLNFAQIGSEVILASDIAPFREQKLRILNGGHTISVTYAYMMGLQTVGEMMNHPETSTFVEKVILSEILPTVQSISKNAPMFAQAVLDRFRNPYIVHRLLSITFQHSAKMQMRNAATFERYFQQNGHLPPLMTTGFAAYLLFSRADKYENGQFFGKNPVNDASYLIQDDKAGLLNEHWERLKTVNAHSVQTFVNQLLMDERLFDKSWIALPHFAETVGNQLFTWLK